MCIWHISCSIFSVCKQVCVLYAGQCHRTTELLTSAYFTWFDSLLFSDIIVVIIKDLGTSKSDTKDGNKQFQEDKRQALHECRRVSKGGSLCLLLLSANLACLITGIVPVQGITYVDGTENMVEMKHNGYVHCVQYWRKRSNSMQWTQHFSVIAAVTPDSRMSRYRW
jgi:hypothetical protein